ncbi:MAG: NPCBM/NEW2 domain-containing protein [Planctomycetota bacterium]|jgi:hypothetical protein|nr:NPCBM/NEW2 domain-containing protein [Planctomycetota bacterium]
MVLTLQLLALVTLLAGTPSQGPDAPSPTALLESVDGRVRRVALADLAALDPAHDGTALLRFEGLGDLALPYADPARGLFRLVDGGRVRARVAGGRDEVLRLVVLGEQQVELSVEELESVVFSERIPAGWAGTLAAADEGDVLYHRRGDGLDPVRGTLLSFEDGGVRFEGDELGARVFPWGEVAAFFVEVLEPTSLSNSAAAPIVVDLLDGSRLRGFLERISADGCQMRSAADRPLRLALESVSEILIESERLCFLSDLAPVEALAASPFGDELGMHWPHRTDSAVGGGPLRAGGRTYTRGIGVHAPSSLTWALDGAWSTLRGAVAVDDEVLRLAARGSVRFVLKTDGELRWRSDVVRGGDPPFEVPPLSLGGVEILTLEVEMADDLHIADRADWLRMILVR